MRNGTGFEEKLSLFISAHEIKHYDKIQYLSINYENSDPACILKNPSSTWPSADSLLSQLGSIGISPLYKASKYAIYSCGVIRANISCYLCISQYYILVWYIYKQVLVSSISPRIKPPITAFLKATAAPPLKARIPPVKNPATIAF